MSMLIAMKGKCRACYQPLTLDEMHYYDHGDGTATCEECEKKWMDEMAEWKGGSDGSPFPTPP